MTPEKGGSSNLARTLAVSTPLSTGDIVGRSFRIFRQNILMIGKILVLPTILICLGRIGVLVGGTYGVKFMSNPAAGLGWFAAGGIGAIIFLSGAVMLWIRELAVIRFLTGFSASYEEARVFVKGRIFSLITLSLVSFMALMAAFGVWAIVMVISLPPLKSQGLLPIIGSFGLATGILGLIFSVIFISLIGNLVSVALALEKRELGALIGEGFSLTLRSFFRSVLFLIITVTSVMLVALPMSLPMTLLIGGYMIIQGAATGTPGTEVPMPIQVLNAVWETAVNMIIGPIYYLAYALYYCDLRMRQEGLDLIERLDDVEAADSSGRLTSHGI